MADTLLVPGKVDNLTAQQALNVILSHCCPNGRTTEEEEANEIHAWSLEGHCQVVKIKAKLVKKDLSLPREDRYQYEVVSLTVE